MTLRAFHLSWGQPLSDGYKDRKREIIIQNGHLKLGLSLSEVNKTYWWVGERINVSYTVSLAGLEVPPTRAQVG